MVSLGGQGVFNIELGGAASYRDVLEKLFDRDNSNCRQRECIAVIEIDGLFQRNSAPVPVRIEGELVGRCPAYFTTQLRDWLLEWGLAGASVSCRARIVSPGSSAGLRSGRYCVRLDIERPFRMTAT